MRFITGGPDLPPDLLQAHEDGDLVLFCGAGVSFPVGLGNFKWLVTSVYDMLYEQPDLLEQSELGQCNYDRVLTLLERRLGDGPSVRRKVIEALQIDRPADLRTHQALLELATDRDRKVRIVTTNFDQGFSMVAPAQVAIESAPKLPVPKRGSWNSIVHLHGLITDQEADGRSLVLTSADFGAAYLTERWASRFVGELFRRYRILFVGYSVEDPVVRYMMDAFAADRNSGDEIKASYVFAAANQGEDRWKAKGIVPLLYDSSNDHHSLHATLRGWAASHRVGLRGKASIVLEHSQTIPTRPFSEDTAVSQMVWAIKEPNAHAADTFATVDPLPAVEWLDVLVEGGLLNLTSHARPAPLVDRGVNGPSPLNLVTRLLAPWVLRHLDKLQVANWVVESGAVLHPDFRHQLRRHLEQGHQLPAGLLTLWTILGSEALVPHMGPGEHSSFRLDTPLARGDWNPSLKFELLHKLSPVLTFRPSRTRIMFPEADFDGSALDHFADAEVKLRCGEHGAKHLRELVEKSAQGEGILTELADDATSLLKQAMELWQLIEEADSREDNSYSAQPSISPHDENQTYNEWTNLIELARDSWCQLLKVDTRRAKALVERWRTIPYPVFRRLTFHAMAESTLYAAEECLEYLLEDDGWWLWSIHVYREKHRLLHSLGPKLSASNAERLVSGILAGSPRTMYRTDISEEKFQSLDEREQWTLLSKLQRSGLHLPPPGSFALAELTAKHPAWRLQPGDQDEFLIRSGEAVWGEPPVDNPDELLKLSDEAVIARLSAQPRPADGDIPRWRRLVEVQPDRAITLLQRLADTHHWPDEVWGAATEELIAGKQATQMRARLAPLLHSAPAELFQSQQDNFARLLREIARISESAEPQDEAVFWQVWERLYECLPVEDSPPSSNPLHQAINSLSGHLAQALLDRVAAQKPQVRGDVSEAVWQRLTRLLDTQGRDLKSARVISAGRLPWFYSVDPEWTEHHLLPYFDQNHAEAVAVWQGFLWHPRMSPELWTRIKPSYLQALQHKKRLGPLEEQIARLFAFICIDQPKWLDDNETRAALRTMDSAGRATVAAVIWKRLENAGESADKMWLERIGPWMDRVWPKDANLFDPDTSQKLAMAATHAGKAFPAAVTFLAPLLTRVDRSSLLEHRLSETDYPEHHAPEALHLLDRVVDRNSHWPDPNLRALLNRIKQSNPELAGEPSFRSLDEYLLRYGL